MPIWKHPAVNKQQQHSCRRGAAKCLTLNHEVRTVDNALTIATRGQWNRGNLTKLILLELVVKTVAVRYVIETECSLDMSIQENALKLRKL